MKNNLLIKTTLLLLVLLSAESQAQSYQLFWYDEFNGTALDENYWNYELGNGNWGWGTGQVDYDTKRDTNVHVRGGYLTIQTLKESNYWNTDIYNNWKQYSHTSGRLNTAKKLSFKHGKVEMRAKVPKGVGEGVALWMLPTFDKFGGWPRSGEIDVLEICGAQTTQSQGTMHFGESGNDQHSYAIYKPTPTDLADDFHVYGIEWTATQLKWYIDGNVFKTADISVPYGTQYYFPFNEEFYIILSAGVGAAMCGKDDGAAMMAKYIVDYVRVYKTADEIVTIPAKIQAEAFTSEKGTQKEVCTDTDGGYDMGQIGTGDFLSYNLVAQDAGLYKATFRVAAGTGYSGAIKISSGGVQLGTANVSTTGGWQSWQDVLLQFTLKKGVQNITLDFTGQFNLNYVNYELISTEVQPIAVELPKVFPNPFSGEIHIASQEEDATVRVFDLSGRIVLYESFKKGNSVLNTSQFSAGVYLVQIETESAVSTVKLVKE